MRRILLWAALAALLAVPCSATFPTTVVTLSLVNPDGTYPASVATAYAKVTSTTSGDPLVVGTVWQGTYSATTGRVTWTMPQNCQALFVVKSVSTSSMEVNGTYTLGSASTYNLNLLIPVTAPTTAPAYMSNYLLKAGGTMTGTLTQDDGVSAGDSVNTVALSDGFRAALDNDSTKFVRMFPTGIQFGYDSGHVGTINLPANTGVRTWSLPDKTGTFAMTSDLTSFLTAESDPRLPAPSTLGNVLTSNGSAWTSSAPPAGATAPLALTGSSDTTQLIVKGHTTQTSALMSWKDYLGVVLSSVTGDGRFHAGPSTYFDGANFAITAKAANGYASTVFHLEEPNDGDGTVKSNHLGLEYVKADVTGKVYTDGTLWLSGSTDISLKTFNGATYVERLGVSGTAATATVPLTATRVKESSQWSPGDVPASPNAADWEGGALTNFSWHTSAPSTVNTSTYPGWAYIENGNTSKADYLVEPVSLTVAAGMDVRAHFNVGRGDTARIYLCALDSSGNGVVVGLDQSNPYRGLLSSVTAVSAWAMPQPGVDTGATSTYGLYDCYVRISRAAGSGDVIFSYSVDGITWATISAGSYVTWNATTAYVGICVDLGTSGFAAVPLRATLDWLRVGAP